jgi:hypothetical protein
MLACVALQPSRQTLCFAKQVSGAGGAGDAAATLDVDVDVVGAGLLHEASTRAQPSTAARCSGPWIKALRKFMA